jgi:hypothetical protein
MFLIGGNRPLGDAASVKFEIGALFSLYGPVVRKQLVHAETHVRGLGLRCPRADLSHALRNRVQGSRC